MTFIVEDGSGIVNANALVSETFVDTYFLDRGITTWTGVAAIKQQAIIKATDYIKKRFGLRFRGALQFPVAQEAKSVITFTQQPVDSETMTLDGTVFTFKTTAVAATDIEIGSRMSVTIDNAILVINAQNLDFGADQNPGLSMVVVADYSGEDGNLIAVSTSVTGATWSFATLNGGNDENRGQAQPFPRNYLFTDAGYAIQGVPQGVKEAVAEYALRALTADLAPDPTVSGTGQQVKFLREKVGPIEEEVSYVQGSPVYALQSYPSADKLLVPYMNAGGGSIR